MGLSKDLVQQFVEATKDITSGSEESFVLATVVVEEGVNYVKIDGADTLTPVYSTTTVNDGDRVTVMLKNHSATITGNITSPSVDENKTDNKIEEYNTELLGKLQAEYAQIGYLEANYATIKNLESEYAKIDYLNANYLKLTEGYIDIGYIKDASISTAQIADAAITVAKIQNGFIDNLVATQGKFEAAHIGQLTSDNLVSGAITTDKLSANAVVSDKIAANAITSEKIKAGSIDTSKLAANSITSDKIDAGAVTADKIYSGAINSTHISADSINASHISSDSIGTSELQAESVTSEKLASGAITTDKIEAGCITADKIDAGAITSEKLAAGAITSDHIDAATIDSIEVNAGNVVANRIQTGDIKIGDANIVDGTISGAKISKASITAAQIADATITDAKIKALSASKITTGTLDASKITVKNLKADSITTGSLTIQGDNLIRNSIWQNFDQWTMGDVEYTITDEKYDESNVIQGIFNSESRLNGRILYTTHTPCFPGEDLVASIWIKTTNLSNITYNESEGIFIEFEYFDEDKTQIDSKYTYYGLPKSSDIWERIIMTNTTPPNAKYFTLSFGFDGMKGIFKIAKPMVSRGTLASVWKPHTDELISNGGIVGDKLAAGIITSDKLNIDELFVSDNGFIQSLKAVEIDASRIRTGKIDSERLDVTGLVSFEAFTDDIKPVFSVENDRTYINGGMIAANSITAGSIDLYSGINVRKEDGSSSFSISSTGEVNIDGTLKSHNYKADVSGYIISTDGHAEFNDIKAMGTISNSKAGMTNEGVTNEAIRFWAGAPYESRESAPFRVNQNGDVFASKGEFTGLLKGTLDSGDVQVYNNTITINEAGTETTALYMSSTELRGYTDFWFGHRIEDFQFSSSLSEGTMRNHKLALINEQSTGYNIMNQANKNATGEYVIFDTAFTGGGAHQIKYHPGCNGMIFDSTGSNVVESGGETNYDFKFERRGNKEPVIVKIHGYATINSGIRGDGNEIEIRNIPGTGWGFYAY